MKFEQRKSVAQEQVVSFLANFSAPRGLTEDAMAVHVAGIADAFARKMPVTDQAQYYENIEKTFTKIRDGHKGYAWPVQSEFVEAMPSSYTPGPKVETYKADDDERAVKAFDEGAGVPEAWVWGQQAWRLISSGRVSKQRMDEYRHGSVRSFRDVYRSDAYSIMQGRYGDIVAPYFSERRAAE